ncbi:MAG: hypothetical protein MI824_11405 [Hyphomicrobiales bacterium]|nr:hypothetical protein [Hyphomicrobiales bacterium]
MGISKHSTIFAAIAMTLAVLQPQEAEARPGKYVTIAAGLAVSSATAAIMAYNRLYRPNRYRRHLGPHHIATYYRPYRSSKAKRTRYRAKRKHAKRR